MDSISNIKISSTHILNDYGPQIVTQRVKDQSNNELWLVELVGHGQETNKFLSGTDPSSIYRDENHPGMKMPGWFMIYC